MKKLHSENLSHSKAYKEGKKLILEALAKEQKKITGIKAADPARKKHYDEIIKEFGQIRAGDLYFKHLNSGLGNGSLVELSDGSVKYDFIAGIGVHYFGHNHPTLNETLIDASINSTIMQGNLQQTQESAECAKLFVELANKNGASFKHCFLTSSGVMANENALKMIFHKNQPANRILAFKGCFMGRTLAIAQVTDKAAYRNGLPDTLNVDYIPFFDPKNAEQSIAKAAKVLERYIARYPGKHAGMSFEMIQGEAGYYPGSKKFFTTLMKILRKHKIAVMVDEVQSFGRTPELFAFQHFGLDKLIDIVTVGKMTQVCCTIFKSSYKPGKGLISQTFTSSSTAIAAGCAILKSLQKDNFAGPKGKIQHVIDYFTNNLAELAKTYPGKITGPFGYGTMIAFQVLDGNREKTTQFIHRLFHNGVFGFIAGNAPCRVRFLIPVGAVTDKDMDAVTKIIEKTLKEFL